MPTHAAPSRCPDWCTSDHSVQHHPEDRLHTGDGISAPLIQQVGRERRGAWGWEDEAIGLNIAFEMPVGTTQPHLALATDDGDWEIRITLESAQRLARALDTLAAAHHTAIVHSNRDQDDRHDTIGPRTSVARRTA